MTLFVAPRAPAARLYDTVSEASSAVVIREYSSSFGLASRLLGEPVRTQVRNIYALVRVADEIVDNPDPDARPRRPGHDARLARGRRPARAAQRLQRQPGRARLRPHRAGRRHHRRDRRARSSPRCGWTSTPPTHTQESFETYVYGSAEVVGLMCLRAFVAAPDAGAGPRRRATTGSPRARGGSARRSRSSTSCATSPTTTTCCAATTSPASTSTGSATPTATGSSTTSTPTSTPPRRVVPDLPASSRRAVHAAHATFAELARRLRRTPAEEIRRTRVRVPDRGQAAHRRRRAARGPLVTLRIPDRVAPRPTHADGPASRGASSSSVAASPASRPPRSSRRAGHSVDLLEKNDELGGRVGSVERDGFRFDTGASWYLMPEVFEHFFSPARHLRRGRARPHRARPELPGVLRGPPRAGGPAARPRAQPRAVRVARARRRRPVRRLPRARPRTPTTWRCAGSSTAASTRPRRCSRTDVVRRAPSLGRLLTRSLESHVAASFTDRRIRQVLGYPAVFLGSSPSRAPSIYHLMSRLDLGDRVLYPQGGFTRLIEVIAAPGGEARRAAAHGRRGHRDRHDAAAARRPGAGDGRRAHRPADGAAAYARRRRRRRGRRPAPPRDRAAAGAPADPPRARVAQALARTGCGAGDAGRRGRAAAARAPLAVLHRRLAARTSATSSAATPRVPDPASIYVCKPSETDSSVAPPGYENLFVLVPVPADTAIGAGGDDGGGSEAVERTADAAIDLVAAWADVPDLRERIRVRHTVGPQDFAEPLPLVARRGARPGAHPAAERVPPPGQRLRQGRRPALRRVDARSPASGLPMCLISAELVLKRLSGDRSTLPVGWMTLLQWSYVAHAGVLPGRHAPARARLPARVLRQPLRLLLTIAPGRDAVPAVGPLRHRRRSLALRRRPDAAVAGRRGSRWRRSRSSSSSRWSRC